MILGGVGRGNFKSWKTLRVERSGWKLVERINTSPRYVINITGLDPQFFGELGGGGFPVLLDVLGRWNLVGVSGTCTNWIDNSRLSDTTIWGDLEGGKPWKLEYVYLTNGRSELKETWYMERSYIDAQFSIWIVSGDMGGGGGRGNGNLRNLEILRAGNLRLLHVLGNSFFWNFH